MIFREFHQSRTILSLLLVLGLSTVAPAEKKDEIPETLEQSRVRDCFEKYKSANVAKDGEAILDLVNEETFTYFEKLRKYALLASEEKTRGLEPFMKKCVLSVRLYVDGETLKSIDGKELYSRGITDGWFSDKILLIFDLDTPTVNGDKASGVVTFDDEETKLTLRFVKESGVWKVDETKLYDEVDRVFREQIGFFDYDEDAYVISLLEEETGLLIPKAVWQPVSP